MQVTVIIAAVCFAYYAYYHFEHLHYHVTRGYAHLGYADAQHVLGQSLFHGVYTEFESDIQNLITIFT